MNNGQNGPRPFSDITGPAGAPPASKPVITPPPQADPMLVVELTGNLRPTAPATPANQPVTPPAQPSAASPQPTQAIPEKLPEVESEDATLQDFSSQAPYFGHVGKRSKAGRRILIALIALVIVGGLGYGTYWYVQKNTPSTSPVATIQQDEESKETTSETTLFASKSGAYSIDNLHKWQVSEEDRTDAFQGQAFDYIKPVRDTFTIAENKLLSISVTPGGRGGDCEPGADDVPFATGNGCQSHKLEQSEQLPVSQFPKDKLSSSIGNVYAVRFKHHDNSTDQTFDLVGLGYTSLDARTNKEIPLTTDADMGLYMPFTILPLKDMSMDVMIHDKDGKPIQLSEEDLNKVYEVLKTIQLK